MDILNNRLDSILPIALAKPKLGEPCNGCGYCCATEPCALAKEFLQCAAGPCVALQVIDDKLVCGLVRNPLGYLFKAAHPDQEVPGLDLPDSGGSDLSASAEISNEIASALGIGKGCDSDDDSRSASWPNNI